MVKLMCKFPIIQNVSLIVLKRYLLEFIGNEQIVRKRILTRRSVAFLQLLPNGWMDQDATW